MASQKFKDLVARTKELADNVTTELLVKTVSVQEDITKQLVNIKKDYARNRKTYKILYDEVSELKSKSKKPVYDKIRNPLERKAGSGGGSGGLLGALFGGLAAAKMFLMPIISKVISTAISKAGGIGKALLNLMKKGGKSGIRGAAKAVARTASALKGSSAARAAGALGKTGMRAAMGAGTRVGGAVASRLAVRQVATFIGRGVAGSAIGAAGMPLLIASAAAAVGYGTYKLGRYLKLSEKLDDFIKKVSGGKFRDIGDFVLGLADGTVGKELFVWVKDKIEHLFTDAITYLKDRTNDILGKWSPFIDDPLTQAGGADPDKPEEKEEKTAEEKTRANDSFRQQMASGESAPSMQMDMLAGAKAYTDKTPLMMRGVEGYNSNVSSDSGGGETGGLAWKAITKGKNATINSRFGKRKGNATVSSDHSGLDIQADVGTPIYAPEGGVVTRGSSKRGGIQAFLKGNSGTTYGFSHLSKVTASGKVSVGTEIAKSGNTGSSTGPHIHLSIKAPGSDKKINPEGYMIPSSGAKSKAAGGIGDDTPSIASGVEQNIEYARGFTVPRSTSSNTSSPTSQPQLQASRPRKSSMPSSPQHASSASKSGAISGKVGDVKDPRGAMSVDILMASMSPLFV